MATRTRLSIDEFLAGDWPPNTQLIDGEVVMNDPNFRHQRMVVRILVALRAWTETDSGNGETLFGGNWTIAPGQLFIPDVWWVADAAWPDRNASRSDSPPALVVEVRSPATWRFDVGRKREVYEETGVAELWLVDAPASTVMVSRRSRADAPRFDVSLEFGPGESLVTPLLEGFSLRVDDLFAD